MPIHRSDQDFMNGYIEPQPRMRINKTDLINLSTTWQRIDFSGTSTLNTNTFPMNGANKMVYWDSANKLIKFNHTYDKNYDTNLSIKVVSLSLISAVGLISNHVRMRFVVPAPTPIYFPLPDSDGFIDIMPINIRTNTNGSYGLTIYANSSIRQYGLGVEMSLTASPVGNVSLNACDFIVYGR